MKKRKIICPVCEELVDYGICPHCSNNMVIPDDARDKEIENRIAREIDEERGKK